MILEEAKKVIRIEAEALLRLADSLNGEFERAVELILASKGRVVVTGMGKSGLIGQKIASTMASTGTPAFFLHPAEGIHGDLGMIMRGDVVIAISNSGETEEVIRILPVIKRLGASLIAMAGNPSSTLAKAGDVFLDISVKEEACPLGLAPTASTTATLAMGDALAVALLVQRGFKAEDFALFHPGGALGKKLILRVEDLMHQGEAASPGPGGHAHAGGAVRHHLQGAWHYRRDRCRRQSRRGDYRRRPAPGPGERDRFPGSPRRQLMKRNPKRIAATNWRPARCREWNNTRSPRCLSSMTRTAIDRWGSFTCMTC